MTRPPITCHVNDPLSAAARAMWDHDIGLDEILINSAMARKVVSARPETRLTRQLG